MGVPRARSERLRWLGGRRFRVVEALNAKHVFVTRPRSIFCILCEQTYVR